MISQKKWVLFALLLTLGGVAIASTDAWQQQVAQTAGVAVCVSYVRTTTTLPRDNNHRGCRSAADHRGGGGNTNPGTPAGTYTLTVTGTLSGSTTLQHSTTLTLQVS